tara:strand:- start:202 stop:642 length:441 start_codon:yes stop_codon:yes gene_type:complete
MIKKFWIFLLFFLYSCGYTAVYNDNKKQDYNIVILEMSGDIVMNKLIKNELQINSKKNSENNFYVKLNTIYSKKIKSKNNSGIASNYEIVLEANFDVDSKKITFEEKFIVKNISDSIEQKNYEDIIKKNFASSIREKLIIKLLNLQ